MLMLESSHVYMHQHAADKAAALQCIANFLQQDGLTTVDYLIGLQQRESQSATYLGQGIAIPHGTPQSRQAIVKTGVRLVHFPQGVDWGQGQVVYLAVAIAAQSDEHLHLLQLLTKALQDDVEQRIRQAQTADDILAILNANAAQLAIHESLVMTQVQAQDIDDVLYVACQRLKQQQYVSAGFLAGIDLTTAVQLQTGIWTVSATQAVKSPAVCIVQLAEAIQFQSQPLSLLLCVASNEQTDLDKLNHLFDVFFQQDIQQTSSVQDLAQQVGAELLPTWKSQSVRLANAHGLHARPATALANVCKTWQGEILISLDGGAAVSAKSLSQLLSLGAVRGQTLTFMAEPNTPAEQHLANIIQAVEQGLGEDVQPFSDLLETSHNVHSQALHEPAQNLAPLIDDVAYYGVAASTGVAVAPIYKVQEQHYHYAMTAEQPAEQWQRVLHAIAQVKQDLQQLVAQATAENIAQIFTAHIALLEDDELLNVVKQRIDQQQASAEAAWHGQIQQMAEQQAQLKNQLLAERAADLRDVGHRVLAVLCGDIAQQAPNEAYILVKHDLVPSDVARLDPQKVAGIITAVGGASSHSAIVARALGIPAIVGAGAAILQINATAQILLDGETGEFFCNPNSQRVQQAIQQQQYEQQQKAQAIQHCHEPAMTQDGHQVEIACNLGDVHDTAKAVEQGAEAVGLLRTELVFMAHQQAPSEQVQEQDYRIVFDALQGRPLVVRTLDVGGDKPLPYLPMPAEENPFLGVRGIRLSLQQPELLRQQLVALIKAAEQRPLRIMFPMVGRVEEWRAAKAILDDIVQQYPCPQLQVGIMIEVPSAALLAPVLAKEVDFFSIGTNDLTQYVLAIDRGHSQLSRDADALHPSVLMLIERTVQAAHQHGKWVGVCGELASDRKAVPILLGLGVDELSMSSSRIALVKAQIRELSYTQCQQLAQQALMCESAAAVRALSV
ncbi:MAG: phosphoenolpyruvate--protein phosphotransferase [Acinetobacter sp.]|nr:phosphoenolpyruvate--protein phosphotransferase [Acinetobacter sp.]